MDIAGWVGNCLTCQLVKEEHQVPSRLFQSLSMPEWKWDMITMDFVCGLLKTKSYKDSVWVIVDRLTKLAHFLPFQMSDGVDKCVELYMRVIVKLHGAPVSIVSDRDPRFALNFLMIFQKSLRNKVHMSTTYHPQTE